MIQIVSSKSNSSVGAEEAPEMGVQEGTKYFCIQIFAPRNSQELIEAVQQQFREKMIWVRSYPSERCGEGKPRVEWIVDLYFYGKESVLLDAEQKRLIDAVETFIEGRGFEIQEKRAAREEKGAEESK